jgi:hypothetical protein
MTCKYYDCGWCYAPSEISTSATPDKKCLNPDACLYLIKSQMTNQTPCNHRTPPKYNVEYLDDKMVIVNGVSYTKKEPTPIVIHEDENTIVVGGVKYQRVEEPKPHTLYGIIREWNDNEDYPTCEELVNRIGSEWLPNDDPHDGEEYQLGWNACLEYLRKKLK